MTYKIISKYIKDISFEIPNTQTFTMLEKEISNYKLNFDIKSKPLKNIKEKKELEKVVLVEVPQYIYPFLYETFIYLFKQSGLQNISIEKKVDFQKMYEEQKIIK